MVSRRGLASTHHDDFFQLSGSEVVWKGERVWAQRVGVGAIFPTINLNRV